MSERYAWDTAFCIASVSILNIACDCVMSIAPKAASNDRRRSRASEPFVMVELRNGKKRTFPTGDVTPPKLDT
jgi:hypothetical protein